MVVLGRGLRPTQRGCRQPKSGRQTFTRKGRLRQTGRGRQPKRHCRLCLLNDNNYNSGLREGSVITTALRRNGPLEFMVSTTTGERGEVKGLKKQAEVGVGSLTLTIANIAWDGARKLACSLRSGTVLSRKVVGKTAHSP